MTATGEALQGMLVCARVPHVDSRGSFDVLSNRDELAAAGVDLGLGQDNLIKTRRGVLRGMHYQSRRPQGKLATVLAGEVYDAAVDLRPDSPTYGRAMGRILRAADHVSLWLPPGLAHGFLALSEEVVYFYQVSAEWDPEEAHVLAWDDPEVGIDWPLASGEQPILSDRDRAGRSFASIRAARP
ncbi:MAG: dTDP-4-dehydrorhamnose 3,5-epimerase [Chthoniobacterales bacterium]